MARSSFHDFTGPVVTLRPQLHLPFIDRDEALERYLVAEPRDHYLASLRFRCVLKRDTSSRMRTVSGCGTASANACDGSGTAFRHYPFTVLLRQNVLQRRRQQLDPRDRRAGPPCGPVEAVEQAAADLVLLQHRLERPLLVERRLPLGAALGVGRQRPLQLVGQPQVVDNQSAVCSGRPG